MSGHTVSQQNFARGKTGCAVLYRQLVLLLGLSIAAPKLVSTGCAGHCKSSERHRQLNPEPPGAGFSEAGKTTNRRRLAHLYSKPNLSHKASSSQLPECPESRWVGANARWPCLRLCLACWRGDRVPNYRQRYRPQVQVVQTKRPQASPGGPEGRGCLECACQAPPQPPAVKGLLGKGAVRRARGLHGSLVC